MLAGPPRSCGKSRCVGLYERPAISQQDLKWDLWRFDARGNAEVCQAFVSPRCNRSAFWAAREMCVTPLWRKIHAQFCASVAGCHFGVKSEIAAKTYFSLNILSLGFFSLLNVQFSWNFATAPAMVSSQNPPLHPPPLGSEYTNSFATGGSSSSELTRVLQPHQTWHCDRVWGFSVNTCRVKLAAVLCHYPTNEELKWWCCLEVRCCSLGDRNAVYC